LVFGLLAGGVIWLVSAPPRGEAIALLPPPTPTPMKIHVSGASGAVANPGVYSLRAGSRVQDAIQAAGGISAHGDTESINLAARLVDGEKVHIPQKSQNLESSSPSEPSENQPNPSQSSTTENLIDINTASQSELEELSGIGPVIAQRIIDYREANGPFDRIEDLQKVSGIGPVTFEKIKDQITVDTKP
jgi:competence protein ComEA